MFRVLGRGLSPKFGTNHKHFLRKMFLFKAKYMGCCPCPENFSCQSSSSWTVAIVFWIRAHILVGIDLCCLLHAISNGSFPHFPILQRNMVSSPRVLNDTTLYGVIWLHTHQNNTLRNLFRRRWLSRAFTCYELVWRYHHRSTHFSDVHLPKLIFLLFSGRWHDHPNIFALTFIASERPISSEDYFREVSLSPLTVITTTNAKMWKIVQKTDASWHEFESISLSRNSHPSRSHVSSHCRVTFKHQSNTEPKTPSLMARDHHNGGHQLLTTFFWKKKIEQDLELREDFFICHSYHTHWWISIIVTSKRKCFEISLKQWIDFGQQLLCGTSVWKFRWMTLQDRSDMIFVHGGTRILTSSKSKSNSRL